jgi:hypothetical protein
MSAMEMFCRMVIGLLASVLRGPELAGDCNAAGRSQR